MHIMPMLIRRLFIAAGLYNYRGRHLTYLLPLLANCLSPSVLAHGGASVPATEPQTSSPARHIVFPDAAGYQTLVVDLHTHSVFSDGHVWPKIRVEEALRDGLDAIAVTEHLEYQPHRADIPHPDRNRAFLETQKAAADSNLLVVAGSEITREVPAGHINALFITDANRLLQVAEPPADTPADTNDVIAYYIAANQWPAQEAVDEANRQGAFVFWNHPDWTVQQTDGIARMNPFHRRNMRADKVHGIEIANGKNYSAEAHQMAMKYDLTLIGVSDVHDLIDWDYPPHAGEHRPVTLAFASARTPEALREALFAGRTVVWFRNLLIGRKAQLMPLLQASLQVTEAAYVADTQTLAITLKNTSDADLELHHHGKLTFTQHGERFTVPAHSSLRIVAKPGALVPQLDLPVTVENALIAPGKRAKMVLSAKVAATEE